MPKSAVRIRGLRKLSAQLKALGAGVKTVLKEATIEGMEPIRQDAEDRAPVDRGVLKENIEARIMETRPEFVRGSVGFTKTAFHGIFAELGTVHHPAQPFLRPAFNAKADDAARATGNALKRKIMEIAARG